MDLDTRSKRASSVGLLLAFVLAPPLADGVIDAGDRQHSAHSYSGIAAQTSVQGAGSSAGTATVTGVGAALFDGAGSSAGSATVTGVGAAQFDGAGAAAGTSTVTGVGASTHAGAGSSAGAATVTGIIQDANNLTAPTPDVIVLVSQDVGTIRVRPDVGTSVMT